MAATPWARRTYSGSAPPTALASGIGDASLSIAVVDGAGYPTVGPFFIVIDRGLPTEEKIEVASRSGDTFTVASTAQRGVDGTAAVSHPADRIVEHCWTATDADEANAASAAFGKITAKGQILAGTANKTVTAVPVGTNGLPLVADSTVAAGVTYKQVGTAGIADEAITAAKLHPDLNLTAFHGAQLASASGGGGGTGGSSVTFGLATLDTDGYFDAGTSTSRLTVPAGLAGIYRVSGTIRVDQSADSTSLAIVSFATNGADGQGFGLGRAPVPSGGSATASFDYLVGLNEDDYVELRSHSTVRSHPTWFSIHYLGALPA